MYFNTIALHSVSGGNYFLAKYAPRLADYQESSSVDVDSNKNIYQFGRGYVTKYDPSGSILWSKTLDATEQAHGAVINDNSIIAGVYISRSGFESLENYFFDGNGNQTQSRRTVSRFTNYYPKADGASGKVAYGGATSLGYPEMIITDSSGVVGAHQSTDVISGDIEGIGINTAENDVMTFFRTSSGTWVIRWSLISGAYLGGADKISDINGSGQDNLYDAKMTGFDSSWAFMSGNNDYGNIIGEVRLGSNFTNVKSLVGASGDTGTFGGIDSDPSEAYIYAAFQGNTGREIYLLKLDSTDFSLVWVREIDLGSVQFSTGNIYADTDDVYITFEAGSTDADYLLKYPADGSVTGTYAIDGDTFSITTPNITLASATISTGFASMISTSQTTNESTNAWASSDIVQTETLINI